MEWGDESWVENMMFAITSVIVPLFRPLYSSSSAWGKSCPWMLKILECSSRDTCWSCPSLGWISVLSGFERLHKLNMPKQSLILWVMASWTSCLLLGYTYLLARVWAVATSIYQYLQHKEPWPTAQVVFGFSLRFSLPISQNHPLKQVSTTHTPRPQLVIILPTGWERVQLIQLRMSFVPISSLVCLALIVWIINVHNGLPVNLLQKYMSSVRICCVKTGQLLLF